MKRTTKMAIFTYGLMGTIYVAMLIAFRLIIKFQQEEFSDQLFGYVDRFSYLMFCVLIISIISVYKIAKDIKSNYLKVVLILIIPTLIYLLLCNFISIIIVSLTIIVLFVAKGIYKLLSIWNIKKVIKIILTSLFSIATVASILILYKNSIDMNLLMNSYTKDNYIYTKILEMFTMEGFVDISLIILVVYSFGHLSKEIIKELFEIYSPSKEEIKKIMQGTIILFIVFIILTSGILTINKLRVDEVHTKDQAQNIIKYNNAIIEKISSDSYYNEIIKIKSDESENKSQQAFWILTGNSGMIFGDEENSSNRLWLFNEYNKTNSIILNHVKSIFSDNENVKDGINKVTKEIESRNSMVEENMVRSKQYAYILIFGLFAMFVLIEIYEEIRIVQMLEKKKV